MSDAAPPQLSGLVPDSLRIRSARIILDALDVQIDIGFHDYEVGAPQRLLVTIEVWLEALGCPAGDKPERAWNYDVLRTTVEELARARRYNLQETFAHAIFARISALYGVRALRVRTSKPDVYPDAAGVGAEIASFSGAWPDA